MSDEKIGEQEVTTTMRTLREAIQPELDLLTEKMKEASESSKAEDVCRYASTVANLKMRLVTSAQQLEMQSQALSVGPSAAARELLGRLGGPPKGNAGAQ